MVSDRPVIRPIYANVRVGDTKEVVIFCRIHVVSLGRCGSTSFPPQYPLEMPIGRRAARITFHTPRLTAKDTNKYGEVFIEVCSSESSS